MRECLIVGNPNVGKSTLFNSLTKSNEHTGNFHGVTVEEKRKKIKLENETFEIVDLPGMYSLNSFSYEEEVARDMLIKSNDICLMIVDANSLRKNLYLCLQLNELNIDYKILINNYDYFSKHKNSLNIENLSKKLNKNIEIINAKKIKLSKNLLKNSEKQQKNNNNLQYLKKYVEKIKNKYNLDEKTIIYALNGILKNLNSEQSDFIKSFYPEIIRERYKFIDDILFDCVSMKKDFVYGLSKWDKVLLNPFVSFFGFALVFLLSIYLIFFFIGSFLSGWLTSVFDLAIISPIMKFLYLTTDNIWLIEFFKNGVFSSVVTVLGFLPQVCLLFVFLTILEDSGIISRLAYSLDDFLSKLGLNGKAVYIMLLGFGCNTMSTMAARNMNSKNLKIKTALLNPYMSCSARLPVYVLIASAFFGKFAYFVVAGLYLLGIVTGLIVAFILNKTILPTKSSELMLEFPPLRHIDIKHIVQVAKTNTIDMAKRIFSIVVCVGVIVWILTHTEFNLRYTDNMTDSVMFFFADKLKGFFAPIGLNSAGIVCTLIVGIMAKELIVSTMSITNNTITNTQLMSSLLLTTSVVSFSIPSAVSFLIFSLLYCPCVSNLAVLRKETDRFYMWFAIISQFTIAYIISFVVYQSLIRGLFSGILIVLVLILIVISLVFVFNQIKRKKLKCLMCNKKCN